MPKKNMVEVVAEAQTPAQVVTATITVKYTLGGLLTLREVVENVEDIINTGSDVGSIHSAYVDGVPSRIAVVEP